MRRALLLAMVLAAGWDLRAQGCSQCREAVGQTPVQVQRAYRRGIAVLAGTGALVCAGAFVAARRFR